ncbi:PDZ domain containing protein [Gracilaria domingensis]|nr:PDZ domain containing protein [Gracilaria domingensis]
MTAFANFNAIGVSTLFPAHYTSFQGCKLYSSSISHAPRRISRSRVITAPQCNDSFNYNIYQDGEDRSKRVVSDSDRAVILQKPLGIVLEEGQDGMVFVASMDPEGNAAESGEVKEGDVLVAVSATFGDEVWSTRGVGLDRVMKSIRIRSGDFVTLVLESPDKLSERKSQAAQLAANRRIEAREKFGEREVLDPVTWTKAKTNPTELYEYGDPEQAKIDEELKEKLKREIAAPYEQNWILWVGAGILILVLLSVAFGLTK